MTKPRPYLTAARDARLRKLAGAVIEANPLAPRATVVEKYMDKVKRAFSAPTHQRNWIDLSKAAIALFEIEWSARRGAVAS